MRAVIPAMRSIAVVMLLTIACATEPVARSNDPAVTSGVIRKDIPAGMNRQLDVLFVIDHIPDAERLEANLRRFVDGVRALSPNLRLAVTSSCADGRLHTDAQLVGNFVADFVGPDGARLRNYRGDLADLLVRLADRPDCEHRQPILAAQRALVAYENRSFLREHSHLAVLVITDADDTGDLDAYARFFAPLQHRLLLAGVLGDSTPRIAELLARMRNHRIGSLADDDWSAVLVPTSVFRTSLAAPCIEEALLDVDDAPGNQYACAVWYDFPVGGRVVPSCDDAADGPCWRLVEDHASCPGARLVEIVRPPDLPDVAMLNLECVSR